MKRTTNRRQQALEMRAKIQDAAQRLFDEYGYEAVSMEDIAAEVGCSTGNVYYHYKTKEAIAVALSNRVSSAYIELQKQYYNDNTMTAMDRLLSFIEKALLISTEDQLISYSMAYSLKYTKETELAYEYTYADILDRLIDECQGEGSIPEDFDREKLVKAFQVVHNGTLVEYYYDGKKFDAVSFIRQLARVLMEGLNGLQKNNQH